MTAIVANHQGSYFSALISGGSAQVGEPDDLHGLCCILLQETERLVADPAPGISAAPHEDNLRYFDVTIQGPDGSPFQSAYFSSATRKLDNNLYNRRYIPPRTLLARRVPNGAAKSALPDKDLPP